MTKTMKWLIVVPFKDKNHYGLKTCRKICVQSFFGIIWSMASIYQGWSETQLRKQSLYSMVWQSCLIHHLQKCMQWVLVTSSNSVTKTVQRRNTCPTTTLLMGSWKLTVDILSMNVHAVSTFFLVILQP